MPYIDQAELQRIARGIAQHGAQVGAAQQSLRADASATHWHSPGATAFADALECVLGRLAKTSNCLFETAALLTRHQLCAERRAIALDDAARSAAALARKSIAWLDPL